MAWVKLDDRFFQHPKIVSISSDAFRLYVNSICYASLYQTDGKILANVWQMLSTGFHNPSLQDTHPDDWVAELVAVGLWEKAEDEEGSYRIHDYLDYNFSKKNREILSKMRKESGSKGGVARAKQIATMLLEQRRSKRLANVKQNLSRSQTQTQTPSPSQRSTKDSDNTSPRGEESWPSPRLLIAKYNAEAPDECPAVKTISPGRLKKAKAYLQMFPAEEWWTVTFKQFHVSRYLRGLTNGSEKYPAVARDFDWLLSKGHDQSENCVKVHDGRYQDGPR